jgi:hypothetical protein
MIGGGFLSIPVDNVLLRKHNGESQQGLLERIKQIAVLFSSMLLGFIFVGRYCIVGGIARPDEKSAQHEAILFRFALTRSDAEVPRPKKFAGQNMEMA